MARRDDIPKTDPSEIEALIQRLKQFNLEPRDAQLVERLLRLVPSMASLIQHKNASIKRLKRLIFGPSSDKRAVTGSSTEVEAAAPGEDSEQQPGSDSSPVTTKSSSDQKLKRSGHGRMAASAYTGARDVICRHPDFKAGDHCPDSLCRGHLYPVSSSAIFIQLTGQPLVGATRYEQEVLRCSACLERFTAPMPAGVTPEKCDATCDVSLAIAKYGAGLPWYRLARMQESFGVPMPESAQFERCEAVANAALPVDLGLMAHVVPPSRDSEGATSSSRINSDGSFRISGLCPGKAMIHLTQLSPSAPKEFLILRVESNGVEQHNGIEVGQGEQLTGVRVVVGSGAGVIRGEVKINGGRLDDVRLHLLYHRSGVNAQSNERVDVDARGRFVIEKLFTGDYELMIGPMSVEVTGDAGGKTMSRMPTVKQTVSVRSGAESDITLVLSLRP